MTQKYLDELTFNVIGAAIEVHKTWEVDYWKVFINNV